MKKYKSPLICVLVAIVMLATGCSFGEKSKSTSSQETSEWTITQYGPRDINSSFYTIYNPEKGLIVVDGGWVEDAAYVREIIGNCGGEVDAWILTHPHQDHIGAFNVLYSDLAEITVESVYTVDMASPDECISVASWDSVDAYEDFLTVNVPDIQYLYEGDTLEICGLTFEIINAFGDSVRTYSKDYLNDGSMMFKVTNQEESMLFCADVGVSMSDYLVSKWGDTLKADYIQMGHHGYGGLSDDFYQTVAPKIAFFDAPDWLMLDETGRYDNPENAAFMENMGCKIYSFNSAPNSVVLK